jgi:hypothetical protein
VNVDRPGTSSNRGSGLLRLLLGRERDGGMLRPRPSPFIAALISTTFLSSPVSTASRPNAPAKQPALAGLPSRLLGRLASSDVQTQDGEGITIAGTERLRHLVRLRSDLHQYASGVGNRHVSDISATSGEANPALVTSSWIRFGSLRAKIPGDPGTGGGM